MYTPCILCNMASFKPLNNVNEQNGQCLKGQVLKKCFDDLNKCNDIDDQNGCVDMIYKASLEYDKDLCWGEFAGKLIVNFIKERKQHITHIRKLEGEIKNLSQMHQAQNEELQKGNKELETTINVLEQQNEDSTSEPEVEAALQKTNAKPQGGDRFTQINKAAKCLQDPKYVQERLEIISIQKGCKRKRTVIDGLKEKKAKLKQELEQVEDPVKKEKFKHGIESISKDIDERIQKEREDHKAGCERVKTLNEFALKRKRDQDRRLQEVKSNVSNNLKKAQNSANAAFRDLEELGKACNFSVKHPGH